MSLQYKNYLKITVFEAQIFNNPQPQIPSTPSSKSSSSTINQNSSILTEPGVYSSSNTTINNNLLPYKLRFSFNNQNSETDKIQTKDFSFPGGKCFYFELPSIKQKSKFTKSDFISISAIGTSWMLFNSTLASIEISYYDNIQNFTDQKQRITLKPIYNSTNSNAPNQIFKVLISIWCEYASNNINFTSDNSTVLNNSSLLNKTYNNNNNKIFQDISVFDITTMLNNTANNNNINHLLHHLYNQNSGSCDLNNYVSNNNSSFHPFSERINTSKLLEGINTVNSYSTSELVNMVEMFIEKNGNNLESEIIEKLRNQINILREKEESIRNQQIENAKNIERMKEKEIELNKEKTRLEEKIKKFKQSQVEFEKKNESLTKNANIFKNELTNYLISKQITYNQKNVFYNLNYYLQTGQNIPIENPTIQDNNEVMSVLLSCNNSKQNIFEKDLLTSPKSNKNVNTKEIVLETLNEFISSNKIKGNTHPTFTEYISNGGSKEIKYNPPVAQINLGSEYQTPKAEKVVENKLLDSLECNFIPHGNNNKTTIHEEKSKKGRVVKRNNNDITSNLSKVKNKGGNGNNGSTGQTIQVYSRSKNNLLNSKGGGYSNCAGCAKRDLSQNNKNDISGSNHKMVSHKKNTKN